MNKSPPSRLEEFNPQCLVLARESRGITQCQLAESLSTTQGRVSKIEDGLLPIGEQDLKSFERVLKYPRSFYFQNVLHRGLGNSFFRKRASFLKTPLKQLFAKQDIYKANLGKLFNAVEIPDYTLPFCDPDEHGGDVLEIVTRARTSLRLPERPVANLSKAIEDCGCLVVNYNFETKLIDGCSDTLNDGRPVIFINPDFPSGRIRYTIAHELGHVIMHRIPGDPKVGHEQANEFASQLLMPADAIKSEFYPLPLTIEKLARLKLRWNVSMAALLYRAFRLGIIKERQYHYLRSQMSVLHYNVSEPYDDQVPPERPALLDEILALHRKELNYSVSDMGEKLSLFEDEYLALYERGGTHIKLAI